MTVTAVSPATDPAVSQTDPAVSRTGAGSSRIADVGPSRTDPGLSRIDSGLQRAESGSARAEPGLLRAGRADLRALAQVPVGAHGLAEAALAWQHLRPRGDAAARLTGSPGRAAAASAYLPIAYTDDELVAGRLVRVLTGLTWAVVAGSGVGVPRHEYHRVGRALTGTWRRYRNDLTAVPGRPNPAAAAALWRMALLLHGEPEVGQRFSLRIAVPYAAVMLCRAAQDLGVVAMTDPGPRGNRTVMISGKADLRRMLAITRAIAG